MGAFAYAETYSRTRYSDGPVTYLVLDLTVPSMLLSGISRTTTTDPLNFERALREAHADGMKVIRSRLPLFMREEAETTLDETESDSGEPLPLKVKITRVPLDKLVGGHQFPSHF